MERDTPIQMFCGHERAVMGYVGTNILNTHTPCFPHTHSQTQMHRIVLVHMKYSASLASAATSKLQHSSINFHSPLMALSDMFGFRYVCCVCVWGARCRQELTSFMMHLFLLRLSIDRANPFTIFASCVSWQLANTTTYIVPSCAERWWNGSFMGCKNWRLHSATVDSCWSRNELSVFLPNGQCPSNGQLRRNRKTHTKRASVGYTSSLHCQGARVWSQGGPRDSRAIQWWHSVSCFLVGLF